MVRARFLAIGAGVCLQPPRGDLVSVWGRWAGRDGGERTQQEAFADRTGASSRGRSVGRMAAGCRRRRQAGSGRARNRARARLNWVSQGQRRGRCKVRRRAERVIRPTRAKTRRLRVLVITVRSPRPIRASSGPGYAPSPGPPARRRWRRSAPTACGSARRRT